MFPTTLARARRFCAVVAAAATIAAMLTPAFAAEDPTLSHRTERLERSHSEQAAEPPLSRIQLVGAIEVDAVHASADDSSSDSLDVSTMELGLDTRFSPLSTGHILLLYEEGATDAVIVDEAMITLFSPDTAWSLTAGRLYAPFGDYSSALLSDPLTLMLGESRETALQLGWSSADRLALLWLANGVTKSGTDDRFDLWGIHLGLTTDIIPGVSLDTGLSWSSNLADSDGLQTAVAAPTALTHRVPGLALHLHLSRGAVKLIAERVSALRRFAIADLAHGNDAAKPAASNLEIDFAAGPRTTLAVARQQTRQAAATGLPRSLWLAAVTMTLDNHSSIGVEFAHGSDYRDDTLTVVTLRLASRF